jgi:predicted nucleic acid-binding protein
MGKGFCLDASVGAKWFFDDEDNSSKAKKLAEGFLTGQFELVVSSLYFYELGNALVIAARSGRVTPEWGLEALDILHDMDLTTVAVHDRVDAIFALGYQLDISFYDASYILAAEDCGYPLVTADRRLYNVLSPDLPFVKLLNDIDF